MFDTIPDMAAKRAELSPEATAFIDMGTGRQWSFAQIEAEVGRIAAGLHAELGLAPGDRLGVLCHNRAEFFILLLACQRAGVILAPLNWRQPPAELAPVAQQIGLRHLLHDAPCAATAASLAATLGLHSVAFDSPGYATLRSHPPLPPRMVDATKPWYLLFTSGTTGTPKAVIQTARMCWANTVNIGQAIGLTGADTSVNFLPLFHTAGINLYTMPLFLSGGRSHIFPKFEPADLLALLAQGEITQFFGVPAIFQAFSLSADVERVDWSTLRMGCGGAPLPEPLIQFFAERGCLICNGFGMTETGPTAFLMDAPNAARKIGSVGKAQMLTEVRLDGVAQGEEGAGEVQMRGPAITPGYFENAEATKAAFTSDGWLKSGDIAQRDGEGYYAIVDRIKDMFISGGENVYPAEVERVLNHHPDVLEAAVIGVADAQWGEVGAAYLIPRTGRSPDLATLPSWCRERLAAYKIPKSFTLVEDLPRTAAGKVRKPDLKDLHKCPTP